MKKSDIWAVVILVGLVMLLAVVVWVMSLLPLWG